MSGWKELLKAPSGVMVSGIGAVAEVAQKMQDAVNATVDSWGDGTCETPSRANYPRALQPAQRLTSTVAQPLSPSAGATPAALAVQPADQRFSRAPADVDLSDDMVKVVHYDIVYLEPDNEAFIAPDEKTVVNYNTRADQLAAVLVAKYVRNALMKDPSILAKLDTKLDEENLRYWKVSMRVTDRYAKEETYYDRRQTKSSEAISSSLSRIAAALGA